jgi:phage FluMu protein Com
MAVEQRYCEKCGKTLAETNFYTYKNGEKCELCKPCLTLHINNWEPDTFTWLLEKFDVPWLPWEWNVLRDRAYAKNPYKMTGMSVFGKYLSKMKLKQWNQYGWADTERLQKEHDEEVNSLGGNQDKAQLDAIKEAFENGEITEAQYKTYAETHAPDPGMAPPETNAPGGPPHAGGFEYPVNSPYEEVELVDVGADLTNDDKVYLAMKWGRLYRADEWVSLEKLYNEFKESFDIQGAAREDTLKMICKTSLKMNQAIDCGDVDAYQKLSRVYDAMMKSAKFTEAQNKDGKGDFVDSVGEMVAYCEKEGGQIPPHKIDVPYDVVDKIINDLKLYNKTLIYEDKSLAEEIENYLKNKKSAEEMKRDREEARLKGLDAVELKDEDYADFSEEIHNQKEEDIEMLINEEEG